MNQANIGQRIKKKREQQKLSLQFVADKLDVNRSSVMRWENGETGRIKLPILEKLAQILQTTPEYLMGYEDELSISASRNVAPDSVCLLPVLDKICLIGETPDWQHTIDYEVANSQHRHNAFFLRVAENSMAPCLDEGDYVLISRCDTIENGEIGLFLLDDQEYMIRLYRQNEKLEFRAFNPYFPALSFDPSDASRIKTIGKIIESRRKW